MVLVSTMWYDGGENVGTTEKYEKTLELEEIFQKLASSAIHLIPYSVRFVGSHDRISACDAIDLDMMHTVLKADDVVVDATLSHTETRCTRYIVGETVYTSERQETMIERGKEGTMLH